MLFLSRLTAFSLRRFTFASFKFPVWTVIRAQEVESPHEKVLVNPQM